MADSVSFFEESPEPPGFSETKTKIEKFIELHSNKTCPVVLVTSGGTMVPLEGSTVRFIDNFSIGTRGSASAEYFLSRGCCVLFLHRRGSLEPFSRHLPQSKLLDVLEIVTEGTKTTTKVKTEYSANIATTLQDYQKVKADKRLLSVEFITITDYLYLLRACSKTMSCLGHRALLYLAAAVSDFYIPRDKMPQHKIQSSDGPLQLSLELVPKMLEALVKNWIKGAFIVSFKLETDPSLLIKKAKQALEKYQHQIVIGNILERRKMEVVMVSKSGEEWIRLEDQQIEIESRIVDHLLEKHIHFSEGQ